VWGEGGPPPASKRRTEKSGRASLERCRKAVTCGADFGKEYETSAGEVTGRSGGRQKHAYREEREEGGRKTPTGPSLS